MKISLKGVLPPVLTVALGAGLGQSAQASCADLLSALEKADREPRVAQLELAKRDAPLTGRPAMVRIGKVLYDGSGGGEYERIETDGSNPVLAQMRRTDKAGASRCASAGTGDWRGTAVVKYSFNNPLVPKNMNPAVFWIARATGLPVYDEVPSLGPGGNAWLYGDAVKTPPAKK